MELGIKSVTMDDVARKLGISKKTLYKYVDDKNDLVEKILDWSCDVEYQEISKFCEEKKNAIDESFEISKYIMNHLQTMHPSIVFDLQKYHGEAWNKFTRIKKDHINQCYMQNIEKGKKEGLYREDVNAEVITKFYTSRFEVMFDTDLFPPNQFKASDIYMEIFRYHIRGIASEKGIKYLASKISKK